MVYLDPTTDLVFKKLFGTEANKELLISFLNGILGRIGDQLIADVDFCDPYNHLPLEELKLSIVDVRCTDKLGNSYIVEMQVNPQSDYLIRCHYYTACGLSLQLKKGDKYEKLLPVVFIGITNFKLFEDHSRYLSHYYLLDTVDHVRRLHHEEFHFIELPKFTKSIDQLENINDKWIYFLRHAGEYEKTPQQLQKTEPLRKAFEVLERSRWTKDELIAYEKAIDAERVRRSELDTAKQSAKMERSIEIAKGMLIDGYKLDVICKLTGLSEQEVEALR